MDFIYAMIKCVFKYILAGITLCYVGITYLVMSIPIHPLRYTLS